MITTEALDRLEHRLTKNGMASHEADIALVADLLVRTGTLPALAGILTDPERSDTERYLALARAMRALRAAAWGSIQAA